MSRKKELDSDQEELLQRTVQWIPPESAVSISIFSGSGNGFFESKIPLSQENLDVIREYLNLVEEKANG